MTRHRNRFLVNKTNRCTEFQFYSNCSSTPLLVANGHHNCIKRTTDDVRLRTPDDGQKSCPKHVVHLLVLFTTNPISCKSVQWKPSCSMRTDTTKLIVAFGKFANALKKNEHTNKPGKNDHLQNFAALLQSLILQYVFLCKSCFPFNDATMNIEVSQG